MASSPPTKTIIEETQDICTLCGGRGQQTTYGGQTTAMTMTCRQCHGVGYIITKRVIRTEQVDG